MRPSTDSIRGAATRLEAFRLMGRKTIPANIAKNLEEASLFVRAEAGENTCRLDYTPNEALAVVAVMEEAEREAAKKRMLAGKEPSGKLPEGEAGRVRDKLAALVGMSGKTLEKGQAVLESVAADFGVTQGEEGPRGTDAKKRDGPKWPIRCHRRPSRGRARRLAARKSLPSGGQDESARTTAIAAVP